MRAVIEVLQDGKPKRVEGELVEVSAGPKEVWAVALSGGDANDNKRMDLTAATHLRLPVFPDVRVPVTTKDVPVDEAFGLAAHVATAAAGFPGLGPAVSKAAQGALALLRSIIGIGRK